jgi:hypothetical protein
LTINTDYTLQPSIFSLHHYSCCLFNLLSSKLPSSLFITTINIHAYTSLSRSSYRGTTCLSRMLRRLWRQQPLSQC